MISEEELEAITTGKQKLLMDDTIKAKLPVGKSKIITIEGNQYIIQNFGEVSLEELLLKLQPMSSDITKKGIELLKEFFELSAIEQMELDDFLPYDAENNILEVSKSEGRRTVTLRRQHRTLHRALSQRSYRRARRGADSRHRRAPQLPSRVAATSRVNSRLDC